MRKEPKEFPLSTDSSIEEIVTALKGLQEEAKERMVGPAVLYATHPCERWRAEATYLIGQSDLLDALIWALGGRGEEEGCDDTTVHIQTLEN